MFFESTAKTGLKDIGKNNLIKNETILEILENMGGEHSNKVGYGALDIDKTGLSWILLDWKVQVIKRPIYSEELKIKTWGRCFQKASTYRDFEVYNSEGELAIIATSKWAMMDLEKRSITRLNDDIKKVYEPEEVQVFNEESLEKPYIPEEFINEFSYTVGRKDIDLNNHMHNVYYMNLVYEAFPEDVYQNIPYDNFRITYKKEITLGDTVTAKYAKVDGKHYVVIENKEKNIVNAIIECY